MSLKDMTGWILLVGALIVGALAFFLVRGYLSSQEEQIKLDLLSRQGETGRVVVASTNLVPGSVISKSNMAVGELPAQHISSRAVRPADFKRVKGRVLTRPMNSGEPLLADYIAGLIVERFSDLLAKGERAVSLEVATLETHSGMLLPGDFVDLFVLLKAKGDSERRLLPVLERVKVLAAGQQPLRTADQTYERLQEGEARYSQITVGVPLADAERLVLARDAGDMVYLLRNAGDKRHNPGGRGYFGAGDTAKEYLYISSKVPEGVRRIKPESSIEDSSSKGLPSFVNLAHRKPEPSSAPEIKNDNADQ